MPILKSLPDKKLSQMSKEEIELMISQLLQEWHVPTLEEAEHQLAGHFKRMSVTDSIAKRREALAVQKMAKRRNETLEQQGGTLYAFGDGRSVSLLPSMDKKAMRVAFKKAQS